MADRDRGEHPVRTRSPPTALRPPRPASARHQSRLEVLEDGTRPESYKDLAPGIRGRPHLRLGGIEERRHLDRCQGLVEREAPCSGRGGHMNARAAADGDPGAVEGYLRVRETGIECLRLPLVPVIVSAVSYTHLTL